MPAKRAFVYIVRCADRTFYIGTAKNVPARLAVHNAGRGPNTPSRGCRCGSFSRGPMSLTRALQREYQLKQLTRPQNRRSSGAGSRSSVPADSPMLFFNKLSRFACSHRLGHAAAALGRVRKKRWPVFVALAVLYSPAFPLLRPALAGLSRAIRRCRHAGRARGRRGGARRHHWTQVGEGWWANFSETSELSMRACPDPGGRPAVGFHGARWPGATRRRPKATIEAAGGGARGAAEKSRDARVEKHRRRAAATVELMKTHGWKRIILVTTGWHMPRSAYQFRKAGGLHAVSRGLPFDPLRGSTSIDFVPRGEAWQQTRRRCASATATGSTGSSAEVGRR